MWVGCGSAFGPRRGSTLSQLRPGSRLGGQRHLAARKPASPQPRTRGDEEVEDGGVGLGQELLHKLLVLLLHLGQVKQGRAASVIIN